MSALPDPDPVVPDPLDVVPTERVARRVARDELITQALGAGLPYAEAAGVAGCSSKTVQRLMEDPQARAEVARRRALRTVENIGLLTTHETTAIRKIGKLLESDDPAVVLAAIRIVLTAGPRLRAVADVDARLTAQEQLLDETLDRPLVPSEDVEDEFGLEGDGDDD